jgi:hypothetical protein
MKTQEQAKQLSETEVNAIILSLTKKQKETFYWLVKTGDSKNLAAVTASKQIERDEEMYRLAYYS